MRDKIINIIRSILLAIILIEIIFNYQYLKVITLGDYIIIFLMTYFITLRKGENK